MSVTFDLTKNEEYEIGDKPKNIISVNVIKSILKKKDTGVKKNICEKYLYTICFIILLLIILYLLL